MTFYKAMEKPVIQATDEPPPENLKKRRLSKKKKKRKGKLDVADKLALILGTGKVPDENLDLPAFEDNYSDMVVPEKIENDPISESPL